MWRTRILVPGLVVGLLLVACSPPSEGTDGRLRVAAGAYPLAEAVRWVGADRVAVTDLTPPGTEPHDLELTPTQVDRVLDADLAVVIGGGFQPAVEDAAARRGDPTVVAQRLRGAGGEDPHLWLDPRAMRALVDGLAERLASLDPAGADAYRRRAARAGDRLRDLDRRYATALADCERRVIVTTHDAFGRLADRYRFRARSIAGIAPDQEPDPRRMAELGALVRRAQVPVVFTEELAPPDVARALARETGVPTEVLSPIEGRSAADRQRGADYWSLMERNRARLARAMGCVSR